MRDHYYDRKQIRYSHLSGGCDYYDRKKKKQSSVWPVVLLCQFLVLAGKRFWFNFGSNTHLLLRVQYSCGGVLVIWFWREIAFGVKHILSVQYSCAVVSIFGCSGK